MALSYYIDQEFIEGFHKPLFGKRRHFIDLISIGIVCEDGREYSAISSEYDFYKSNPWVRDNVITPLFIKTVPQEMLISSIDNNINISVANFHRFYGRPNAEIAREIYQFICRDVKADGGISVGTKEKDDATQYLVDNPPTLYGYYSGYDHVLFCSLFGTMGDLPKGFSMYTRDLQQMFDEKVEETSVKYAWANDKVAKHFKGLASYPQNEAEHSAIADARWNKKLHDFIKSI